MSALHTTYEGMPASRAKQTEAAPVKSPRKTHSDAFSRAHAATRGFIAFERTRPSKRNWKPTRAEYQFIFSANLKQAYAAIRDERRTAPAPYTITQEECLLIASDSRIHAGRAF